MPTFKWTGSNDAGYVEFGGTRFPAGEAVSVTDPFWASKLEGNPEFERTDTATAEPQAPLFNPPGPTGQGTGPGTGPYITTAEHVDMNPVPGAGQPTEEELAEQREAAGDAGPEVDPLADEPDASEPDAPEARTTDEGPRRPKRK
jgi:hypothetical protein